MIELVLIDSRSGTIKKSATGRVHIAPSPSAGMEGTPPQEPSAPDAPGDEPGEEEKGYVRYDKAQALTEEQKETARSNIGAGTGSGNAGIQFRIIRKDIRRDQGREDLLQGGIICFIIDIHEGLAAG